MENEFDKLVRETKSEVTREDDYLYIKNPDEGQRQTVREFCRGSGWQWNGFKLVLL